MGLAYGPMELIRGLYTVLFGKPSERNQYGYPEYDGRIILR